MGRLSDVRLFGENVLDALPVAEIIAHLEH